MTDRRGRAVTTAIVVIVSFLTIVTLVSAQEGPETLGGQNLRAYTHVFIAYAIAWLLVAGWVVSIGRKLGALTRDAVERRTDGGGE